MIAQIHQIVESLCQDVGCGDRSYPPRSEVRWNWKLALETLEIKDKKDAPSV